MTLARKITSIEPDTYHGFPVLTLRVGDQIPTPPHPVRYAVRIGPDLARYLLTFNIANNRAARPRNWMKLAADMASDRYLLQPQGPMFDTSPNLFNGQHQLLAVIDAAGIRPGTAVWMVVDFGWPPETAQVIDRGATRTGHDTLKLAGVPNSATIAAAISAEWQLRRLIGTTRSLSGFPVPSQPEMAAIYAEDPDGWQHSARVGMKVYARLQKGGSTKAWVATHHLLAQRIGRDEADGFMEAVGSGAGDLGSPTRELHDHYLRRPYGDRSKTGDTREFYEIVLRAFNAWRHERPMRMPRVAGFVLTVPR